MDVKISGYVVDLDYTGDAPRQVWRAMVNQDGRHVLLHRDEGLLGTDTIDGTEYLVSEIEGMVRVYAMDRPTEPIAQPTED